MGDWSDEKPPDASTRRQTEKERGATAGPGSELAYANKGGPGHNTSAAPPFPSPAF